MTSTPTTHPCWSRQVADSLKVFYFPLDFRVQFREVVTHDVPASDTAGRAPFRSGPVYGPSPRPREGRRIVHTKIPRRPSLDRPESFTALTPETFG